MTGLNAKGNLRYHKTRPILSADGSVSFRNGTIPGDQMKTRRFAALLNTGEGTFTAATDGVLPVFAKGSDYPIYAVSFDVSSFYGRSDVASREILADAIADGSRELEYIDNDHKAIVLYTQRNRELTSDDINFVKSLENNARWENGSDNFSASTSYTSNVVFKYAPLATECLDDDKYIHLACSDNNLGERNCYLSAKTLHPEPEVDFSCWSSLIEILENSTNRSSKVVLESDLDLGGYDDSKFKCKLRITPLSGDHAGFNGQNHTINRMSPYILPIFQLC